MVASGKKHKKILKKSKKLSKVVDSGQNVCYIRRITGKVK